MDSLLPCPYLPEVRETLNAGSMDPHRTERGVGFYLAALRYAQSLWLEGKPAQAILQLNKAWSARLTGDEAVLHEWPPPYRALAWILRHTPDGPFLGNPVRHFQHLASRMAGPNPEPRKWRAWACFHLSESLLEAERFPRDEEQIANEGLEIPSQAMVWQQLETLGWPCELEQCQWAMTEWNSGCSE